MQSILTRVIEFALESQFTINSTHHLDFYVELKKVWDRMNLQFVKYSSNCYKTNWKKKAPKTKKKNRILIHRQVEDRSVHNREARIICLDNNNPKDNIVYILDYVEYEESMLKILKYDTTNNETEKEERWIDRITDPTEVPPTLARAFTIFHLWPDRIVHGETVSMKLQGIRLYPKTLEQVVCTSRLLASLYSINNNNNNKSYTVDTTEDDNRRKEGRAVGGRRSDTEEDSGSDSGSLLDYMKERNLKSLSLIDQETRVNYINSRLEKKTLYDYHPYCLSARVFCLVENLIDTKGKKWSDLYSTGKVYSDCRVCLMDGNNSLLVKENKDDPIYVKSIVNLCKRIQDYTAYGIDTEADCDYDDEEEYEYGEGNYYENEREIWARSGELFSRVAEIIFKKQSSPLKVVCKRKGKMEPVQASTPISITFDRSKVSPLDLQTSVNILLIRFKDVLVPSSREMEEEGLFNGNANDRKQYYGIKFDDQTVTLYSREQFFDRLKKCVIPYLAVNHHLVSRSKYPSPIYPIYCRNILSGRDQEVIYSLKAVLRMFDKAKGIYDAKYWPSKPHMIKYYRVLLPSILNRLFGGSKEKILECLTAPYRGVDQLWFKQIGTRRKKQNIDIVRRGNEEEEEEEETAAGNIPVVEIVGKKRSRYTKEEEGGEEEGEGEENDQYLTLRDNKTKKSCQVNGFKEGSFNFYTFLKSFCYMKDKHVIKGQCVLDLYKYFTTKPQATYLQSKYPIQFDILHKLYQEYENNNFADVVDIKNVKEDDPEELLYVSEIGHEGEEGRGRELVPVHMKLYELCVSPDIPDDLATELISSIGCKSANLCPLNLSTSHPNAENMSNVKYKLLDTLNRNKLEKRYQQQQQRPSVNTTTIKNTEITTLYYTIQCLEELSYMSLNTDEPNFRGNKREYENWFDADTIITDKYVWPDIPIQFDEVKHLPVYGGHLFPIWSSEVIHSTLPNTRKYINTVDSDVMPFTGCHKDLLECIIVNPITEINQI